ncbi:MAG: CBS domain-containing protein [Granulosicoccus sp.]|jgi:CBS domain-containing protein
MNTPIKNLMTTDVITTRPNELMMVVKEIFETNTFHHIPVVDEEEQLIGILSRHDYNKMLTTFSVFKNSKADVANRKFMMSMLVKDVMTKQVAKLHPEDLISVALGIFKENLFHALPIVDEENRVVGMLTTFDLLTYAYHEKRLLNQ